jgi:SAM-dependent methyltransferase
MAAPIYDEIGVGYGSVRQEDPRVRVQIHAALAAARGRLLNVGAGAGSYEPRDRAVIAVEPSVVMLAQRSVDAAPVARGVAEALPFPDRSFDATLTTFSVHHWSDIDAGLAELRRVARRHVVLTFDQEVCSRYWGWRDYFRESNEIEATRAPLVEKIAEALHADRIETVPVPWDCTDGFGAAYWRRPEAYLDAGVRASISSIAEMEPERVARGVERLRRDLDSGEWARRNADLLDLDEADFGYRLIVTD